MSIIVNEPKEGQPGHPKFKFQSPADAKAYLDSLGVHPKPAPEEAITIVPGKAYSNELLAEQEAKGQKILDERKRFGLTINEQFGQPSAEAKVKAVLAAEKLEEANKTKMT